MTVAERLARAVVARRNCQSSGNTEWEERWTQTIDDIMACGPHGSGFDAGKHLIDEPRKCTDRRLTFAASFHHMTEGYYDGWTEHIVTVEATFNGLGIKVSGRNRNDIKDYIAEVVGCWLGEEYKD
jgi:hypothetical protein